MPVRQPCILLDTSSSIPRPSLRCFSLRAELIMSTSAGQSPRRAAQGSSSCFNQVQSDPAQRKVSVRLLPPSLTVANFRNRRRSRPGDADRSRNRGGARQAKRADGDVEGSKSVLEDTTLQSTGFAAINTHHIPLKDIKANFKSEAQLEWERSCSAFTFLPYLKE